jgi:putative salt-induced outer membrane protein YdiY
MKRSVLRCALAAAAALVPATLATPVHARQDTGWSFTGKVTAVFTGGNSEASTFGLASSLRFRNETYQFRFETGAVRTDSGIKERRAVGSDSVFVVEEETIWEKTAEAYYARARYDRDFDDGLLLFVGTDWLRNTFAGIDSRFLVAVGAGNTWAESDDFTFKTDIGLTYTFQQDVVNNPFAKTNFPGVRASWNLRRRFTASTRLQSDLISDLNIEDTDDIRVDFKNALSIGINSTFAFEPSLQLVWRNLPALKQIDLFAPDGEDTGRTVRARLRKLDSFFNVALVVTL